MSANNQQQLMNTTALNRSDSMNRSHGSPKAAAHSPYAQQVLHAADMLEKPSSNQPQTGGNGYYGCSSNSSNGSDSGEHESNGYGASSTTPTYPNCNNNNGYHHQQQYSSNSPSYQQQQGSYPGSPYQRASNNGSGSNTPSRHNSYHQMQMLPAPMSQPQQNSSNNNGGASYANAVPPPPPSYVQATVTAAREWNNTPPQQSDSHEGTPLNRRQHSNSFNQQSNSLNNSQNNRSGRNPNSSQHQRHNSSPHPPAVEGCPEGAHHTPLFGKCEWIQPPPVPEADLQTPAFPCYRLFLGQIRFETTPAEVRWIIEYVTGVQALKVETRGIGCFLAYFGAYDDMVAVQGLHKRILFDHTGIWFARTDEQAHQMQDYVRAALGRIGRGFRLPKDMMVVEEEKLQRALPIPSAPPQYNSVSTPMYSSFQQQQQQNGGAPHHQQQQTGFSKLPEYGTAAQ